MKRKRFYQQPTVRIVWLQVTNHLLDSSDSDFRLEDYNWHDEEEE